MQPVAPPQLLQHSVSCIKRFQSPNGAYEASPYFSAYKGYCWLRDGSFIAHAMSVIGENESATAFFRWCCATILKHRSLFRDAINQARTGITPNINHMPPTRFLLGGNIAQDGWENFQLDGYGTWIWAALNHAKRHGCDISPLEAALSLTVEYICAAWNLPCYDWWEEHCEQRHVSTLGCLAAGLRAALTANFLTPTLAEEAQEALTSITHSIYTAGVHGGHLTKWLGTEDIDASLAALIAPLGIINPQSDLATGTISAIENQLCIAGGVHRFRNDKYYGGGQWPLLSCYLGLAHCAQQNYARAAELLHWACSTAHAQLDLPEQVDWHLLDAAHRPYWVQRWGEVATPLLWSHAMVLLLNHSLADIR